MAQIYSKAFTVLIWLGTIQDLQPDPAGLDLLLAALEIAVPVSDFPKPQLEVDLHSGLPMSDDTADDIAAEYLKIYARILMNDWFKRVWMLQEYCLSQRQPVVLVGYVMLSLRALYGHAPNLEQIADNPNPEIRNKLGSLANLVQGLAKFSFGPTYMPEYISSPEFSQRCAAQKVLWIIMNLGSRISTVPHDQIYGILGLIEIDSLPSGLRPDYSLPYRCVCRRYTKYLIEMNKDLRLLMFFGSNSLDREPSWVVDFRTISPWAPEPRVAHPGHFTKDGTRLLVEGVKTGHLAQVIPKQLGDVDHQIVYMRQFHDTVLTAAAKIRRLPLEQVWREWFTDFLQYMCGQTKGAVAAASQYTTLEEFLNTLSANMDERTDEIDRHWVVSTFGNHDYVLIDDGTVARCMLRKLPDDSEVQHEVWALKGAMQRYVISRDNSGCHRYVGWVSESDGVEMDNDFFSRHQVEQVILV